jgi:hypothetical protein
MHGGNSVKFVYIRSNVVTSIKEIRRNLLNPTVHYLVHKSSSPLHILSQTNRVHKFPSHVFKIISKFYLPSTPVFQAGS